MQAIKVARELRDTTATQNATPGSGAVTPRDCAANAAPVHLDDALAKRVKAALAQRGKCLDAGLAFACLTDLQDALASSRGATATLRANYQGAMP